MKNIIYASECYTSYNANLETTFVYYVPTSEDKYTYRLIEYDDCLRIKNINTKSDPSYRKIPRGYMLKDLTMDSLTREKIDKYYSNVLSKEQIINVVHNVAKIFDDKILSVLGPIDKKDMPHYGKYFDSFFADEMNKAQSNYHFRSCENENVETDVVCIETPSYDMEVKSAVGDNNFKNHVCQNVETSRKTKSMDEMHYYTLCRVERNFKTYTTTIKEIYFGRISENHWRKESNSYSSYLIKEILLQYFDKIYG